MTRLAFRSLGLAIALILGAADLSAQEKLWPPDGVGDEQLYQKAQQEAEFKSATARMGEFRRGVRAMADDAEGNKAALAKAARYYVYRLTSAIYHGTDSGTASIIGMNSLVSEASAALLVPEARKKQPPLNENQKKYLAELTREMHKALREVFKTNRAPVVRVNAARMLAAVAEAGNEESIDTLIALLQDPDESDAVRLFALRGLKEALAYGTPEKSAIQTEARELAAIAAAQAFLTRKIKEMPTEPEKVEALRYLRREAVRALAASRHATMPKSKDEAGRTAWWLLKVARKDGLTPESSLTEQVEGAIGACQLNPSKDLNLDYVAYHVGGAIVDFAAEFARKKGGDDAGVSWKIYAARLLAGLDDLQSHAKGTKSEAYVNEMAGKARLVLQPIEAGKPTGDPGPFQNWLRSKAPTNTTVYNGVADSTIKAVE